MPSSTNLPLTSATSNLAARNADPRDEWSWNDWGSLEEQPVSRIILRIESICEHFLNAFSIPKHFTE